MAANGPRWPCELMQAKWFEVWKVYRLVGSK